MGSLRKICEKRQKSYLNKTLKYLFWGLLSTILFFSIIAILGIGRMAKQAPSFSVSDIYGNIPFGGWVFIFFVFVFPFAFILNFLFKVETYDKIKPIKHFICPNCLKSIILNKLSFECPACGHEYADREDILFSKCAQCDSEIYFIICPECDEIIKLDDWYDEKELKKKRKANIEEQYQEAMKDKNGLWEGENKDE